METKEGLELEIKALENMRKESVDKSQESQRRHDLLLGATLGLFLGIVGGFFVTVFYSIIQTMVTQGKYDRMFWVNVALTAISLVMIIALSYNYLRRLDKASKDDKKAQGEVDLYLKILEKRKRQLAQLDRSEIKEEAKNEWVGELKRGMDTQGGGV